jgi:hypothetical protein
MSKGQLTLPNILDIIAKWRESPLKDPYNDNKIILSVNPKSEYVILYKRIIDELITHIMLGKPADYVLTIKDCKYIKDSLPNKHAHIKVSGKEILYDHLFIKYFIKKDNKYRYDEKYKEDIDIYLYINVYNSIIKKLKPFPKDHLPLPLSKSAKQESFSFSFGKEYGVIEDLLINNINVNKTDLSISKLIEKLCRDIKKILYAHKSKITKDDYNIVLNNIKILDYVSSIYKLCEVKDIVDIVDIVDNENKMINHFIKLFKNRSRLDPENEYHFIDNIFLQIIIILTERQEFIPMSEVISDIYSLYIDTNYDDIQAYLKQFQRRSYNDIFIILQKIYKKIFDIYNVSFDKENEDKILATLTTEDRAIITDKNYKYSTISFIETDSRDSHDSSDSGSGSRGSRETKLTKKIQMKCDNDWSDSISLRELSEFSYKEKKYMTFIKKRNDNTNFFCFDTITIYNFIVQLTNENTPPFIPLTKQKLTPDEIELICNNVSKLTKNKKNLLETKLLKIKYKYGLVNYKNEFLILRRNDDEVNLMDDIGIIKINLFIEFIKLDDDFTLQLPLFNKQYDITTKTKNDFPDLYNINNSEIIRLPLFNKDIQKSDFTDDLVANLVKAFNTNKLLYSKYFPYRKPNWKREPWNKLITSPEFTFDTKEDQDELYARLFSYNDTITRLYFP